MLMLAYHNEIILSLCHFILMSVYVFTFRNRRERLKSFDGLQALSSVSIKCDTLIQQSEHEGDPPSASGRQHAPLPTSHQVFPGGGEAVQHNSLARVKMGVDS